MNGVTSAWLAQIFIMSWRSWRRNKGSNSYVPLARLPYPYELLASFIIFGVLDVIHGAQPAKSATSVLAWGLVIASFMNMFPKNGTLALLNSSQSLPTRTQQQQSIPSQLLYYTQPAGGFV